MNSSRTTRDRAASFRRALSLWAALCATGAGVAAATCYVPSAHNNGSNGCGSGTDFCNPATAICLIGYIEASAGQDGQEGPLSESVGRYCREYEMLATGPCVSEDSGGTYTGCKMQETGGQWICCYALDEGTIVSSVGLAWAPSGVDCVGGE